MSFWIRWAGWENDPDGISCIFCFTPGRINAGLVMATQAVRKGDTIQITGAYGARYNALPLGDIFQRNITIKSGQAPVIHYMPYLHVLINQGKIGSGDIITHVLPLDDAEKGYEFFDAKTANCIKVVLKPH